MNKTFERGAAFSWQPQVGNVVEVYPVYGGYPLPEGLPAGAQVRIVRFDHAYRIVERDGREWQVYMMNVRAR